MRLTTPREGRFELHLPAGTKEQYETAIASIPPDMRLWWRYHTVHSGDTLASLARNYHTTAKSIAEANHLEGTELEADAKLVIPVAPGQASSERHRDLRPPHHPLQSARRRHGRKRRRKLRRFAADAAPLERHPRQQPPRTQSARPAPAGFAERARCRSGVDAVKNEASGRRSETTETAATKPPATKSAQIERETEAAAVVHHKVKTGETLYSIANAYRTTVAALKRDNRNVAVLHPGMILIVQSPR